MIKVRLKVLICFTITTGLEVVITTIMVGLNMMQLAN